MSTKMNYKKTQGKIKKQQKELNRQAEKVKCLCPHKKDGQATLVRKKSNDKNSLEWICYQCDKQINLKRVTDEELRQSIEIIDRVIDVIKFSCKENNENDNALHSKLAKTQYRIRNMIEGAYKASLNENANKNKNRSRNGSGQAARWS